MYVSPNHPNPPRPQCPPGETGQRLATFPRGESQEFRVNLDEYQGHPFVGLRLWERDPRTGEFWPVKGKGCSIRLGEVLELSRVLAALAAGRADAPARGAAPTRPGAASARPSPGGRPNWLPPGVTRETTATAGEAFDEFEGAPTR